MGNTLLVGISGGSGSGKSWLSHALLKHFGPERATVLQQDWYYRDLSHLPPEKAAATDFDHPDALELDFLENQLSELAAGKAIDAPQYAFSSFSRKKETLRIEPRPLVVVEGLFVLHHSGIFNRLDRSVFVDTADDIRLIRRIRRDLSERGYDLDRILEFWERDEVRSYARFVRPQRDRAEFRWNSLQDSAFVPAFLSDLQTQIARNADQPTL